MIYQPTNFRTDEEVAELKRQWIYDGCWDIWDTKGFEHHREELKLWEQEYLKQQEQKRENELLELAEVLGVPGNTKLAAYIKSMERTIRDLQDRLENIESADTMAENVKLWAGAVIR